MIRMIRAIVDWVLRIRRRRLDHVGELALGRPVGTMIARDAAAPRRYLWTVRGADGRIFVSGEDENPYAAAAAMGRCVASEAAQMDRWTAEDGSES